MTTGVLLVNLGTPNSPKLGDVYRYLVEFLTDGRVIDLPWLQRQLLVRGVIIPSRYKQSAHSYKCIWTSEGSPLMMYSQRVQQALQKELGEEFHIELAMRYQHPSLKAGLDKLLIKKIRHLIVFPLFPQYASATTGSVYQKLMEILKGQNHFPKITLMQSFPSHKSLIEAFCHVARKKPLNEYDHYLFSFHGLPERQIKKADRYNFCLKKNCCEKICRENADCYVAQCHQTYQAIVKMLGLAPERTSIAFQSRLGKDPWIEPFTPVVLENLAKQQKKKVLVFCPSFVCDCLETLYEIGVEYAIEFKKWGGHQLDLVQGLNDEPIWIEALKKMILEEIPSSTRSVHCRHF